MIIIHFLSFQIVINVALIFSKIGSIKNVFSDDRGYYSASFFIHLLHSWICQLLSLSVKFYAHILEPIIKTNLI